MLRQTTKEITTTPGAFQSKDAPFLFLATVTFQTEPLLTDAKIDSVAFSLNLNPVESVKCCQTHSSPMMPKRSELRLRPPVMIRSLRTMASCLVVPLHTKKRQVEATD